MTARLPRVAITILVVYAAAVACVVFWPTPVDRPFTPLLDRFLTWTEASGLGWISYSGIEFGANVLMWMPLGLLVALLVGARRWWMGALVGTTVTAAIESLQLAFFPERFATVQDVAAGLVGSTAGALAGLVVLLLVAARRARRGPAGQPAMQAAIVPQRSTTSGQSASRSASPPPS